MTAFSVDEVIVIHDYLLDLHGGLPGLKSLGDLESALAQPHDVFFGVVRYPTPIEQAGAYLFYLASAHAFVDGNKRTGAIICLSWLTRYGYVVTDHDGFEALTRQIASGVIRSADDAITELVRLTF